MSKKKKVKSSSKKKAESKVKKEVEKKTSEEKKYDAQLILGFADEQPLEKQPVFTVKSLSKSFKKKLVLKDLNFEVENKDIFGVVGMSGSGKTTLFQLLAGIIIPTSGDVLIRRDLVGLIKVKSPDFLSVYKKQTKARKSIGFASQTPSFYEHLTVEENVKLYGSLYGMKSRLLKERSNHVLKLVGLTKDKDTVSKDLSGGMQRRLDIALAILHEPKILFLDEPTSDLDPIMRVQVWNLIKEINEKGTTVIIASHILDEIEQLCTKIAILHGQRIVGYGSLDELKGLFAKYQEVKIRLASGNYSLLMKKLKDANIDIDRMFEREGLLVVYTNKEEKNLSKILRIIERLDEKVSSLDISEAHLTEIFEMLAKKEAAE